MRKRTKLLPALLALVMVLGLLPATALAADTLPITWLPDGMEPQIYLEKTNQILAKNGTSWYWLDTRGNIVSELGETGYDTVYGFADGLALVSKDYEKCGFIDETGKVVIPLTYSSVGSFSDGLAPVWNTDKWGFINTSGETVMAFDYDDVCGFSEGLAAVEKDGKCGYIDTTGKLVIPMVYDRALDFNNGVAVVDIDWNPVLINKAGQQITGAGDYDEIENWSDDGLITVSKDFKLGVVDTTGKQVILCEYDGDVDPLSGSGVFHEGLMGINTWDFDTGYSSFYLDKTGKKVISGFDWGFAFCNGLAIVKQNDRMGVIDTTGNIVFYLEFPEGKVFDDYFVTTRAGEYLTVIRVLSSDAGAGSDLFELNKSGRMGAVDRVGNLVLPYEYNDISIFGPVGWVMKDDGNYKYGLFAVPGYQPPAVEAIPTNDKLTVNGTLQTPTVYKIDGGNYFKLRDLAVLLNGTSCQFDVGYDEAANSVTATSGKGYTKLESDMQGPAASSQPAAVSNDKIIVNGQAANVEVYKIDGGNYFKLRDLGDALGFQVGWDPVNNIASISTNG